MAVTFNADEILEMAQELERNGAQFYESASKYFTDPKEQQLLIDLANWERQHEKFFKEIQQHLDAQEKEVQTFDPEDEAGMYLQAMADGHVFNVRAEPAKALTGRETKEDILKTALQCEKDSIVFYLGLRDLVPSAEGKGKVDEVIREEMKHISIINRQIAEGAK